MGSEMCIRDSHPTTPVESVDGKDGTVTPSPISSTAGTHTAEKSKAGLPADTVQTIGDSGTESDKTEELEPEEDPSYSTPVFSSQSDRILRKRTRGTSDVPKDLKDGAPPPRG